MQNQRPGRGTARRYVAVQVPVEHKDLAKSIQSLVDATAKAASGNAGGAAVDYAATETLIAEQTAAIERAAHKEVLRSLDVDAPRIRVRGEQFAKIGRAPVTYHTLAGDTIVERTIYRQVGVRNGPMLDPIAMRTGAYGRGWLPALRLYGLATGPQRGSDQHYFWQHYWADRLRREGYRVTVEAPRVGGRVDVLAEKAGERVGGEIETGKSDVVRNVENCQRSGYGRIFVVAKDAKALRKVKGELGQAELLARDCVRVAVEHRLCVMGDSSECGCAVGGQA